MTVTQFAARVHAVIARPGAQPEQSGDVPTAAETPPAEGAATSRGARVAGLLRRHWLIAILLTAGLVLRVLTIIAYRPALLYIDSLKYLYKIWPGADPLGYKVLLKVMLAGTDLSAVAILQHLLGLAMAVAIYLVLVRRGTARWLAALAAAPVLLDAYQLQMEATIMPDVLFEVLIVAGLTVLLWRPAVSMRAAIAAGLILGASATVRQIGEIFVLPAVVFALAAGGGWRRAIGRAVLLGVAFVVPILVYCTASLYITGHFWLSAGSETALGRVAVAVNCSTLKVPAPVKAMCPTPSQQARGVDWLEHDATSPLHAPVVPPGMTRKQLIAEFRSAVEHQQPVRIATSVLRDAARLFEVTRQQEAGITPIYRWQFQDHFPVFPPETQLGRHNEILIGFQKAPYQPFHDRLLTPSYGGPAQVNKPLASFLRDYQLNGGYTPGPLFAVGALAGLIGSLLLIRRRASDRLRQPALACLLFFTTGAAVLLASDVFEFSWRYQAPAIVTLPAAGAAGITAIVAVLRRRPARNGEDAGDAEGEEAETQSSAPPAPRVQSQQPGTVG